MVLRNQVSDPSFMDSSKLLLNLASRMVSIGKSLSGSSTRRRTKPGNLFLIRSSANSSVGNGHRKKNASQEAIFQLESMLKEPGEVLDSIGQELSSQDLQLVLTHFAEEGKDSWFALEVFEWMQKTNRVEDETHQLMISIMVNWATRLVDQGEPVEQIKALLEDIQYVGVKPVSRILHSIISAYWEKGKKSEALAFVKQVMSSNLYQEDDPLRYLIGKMVSGKESRQALSLVSELRSSGFRLKATAYSAAMLAAVDEQEQLTTSVQKLRKHQRNGLITRDDIDQTENCIAAYERLLHEQAEKIAAWAAEEEAMMPSVYERLLAMYCLSGKPLDAERNLWYLKLAGKSPVPAMFNAILGICAFNNRPVDAYRILAKMESSGKSATKMTFSVLIGGFIKGGNPAEAAAAMERMLERGFRPEVAEMMVVLTALRRAGMVPLYFKLSKKLSDEGVMEPRVLYFYLDAIKLCIIRLL